MSRASRPGARGNPARSLRIIGGRLRGSKLPVPEWPGLRPTPDRLRETLYNWLGPWIVGRQVADLYAGSGALGLEAASRGAAAVWLVERQAALANALRGELTRLKLPVAGVDAQVNVVCADALDFLRSDLPPLDLLLVDPPFEARLWEATLQALPEGRLAPGGRVYLEFPTAAPPVLAAGWQILKQTRVGEVEAWLLARSG